jgi:hypothetical protein
LDAEPGDLHDNLDPTLVDRRSAAVRIVQDRFKARGRTLHLSLTVAVKPAFGMDPRNLYVVQSALAAGDVVEMINPMLMDYRDGQSAGQMGARGVIALQRVHEQMKALYPGRSDRSLWAMTGAIPMVGQNDASDEMFSGDDARVLLDFARKTGLGRISFWAIGRDNGDCAGQAEAQVTCSGVTQGAWDYTRILGRFARP